MEELAEMEQYPLFLERIFLRSPGINVAMKLRLNRLLSAEQAAEVCRKMILRHPLLASTVEIRQDRKAYFKTNQIDPANMIDVHDDNHIDWVQWYTGEDAGLCHLADGPLFKTGIFRYTKEQKTDIVFLGHHVIGDGMAFVTIARSFLDFINGDTDVTPRIPPFYGMVSSFKDPVKPGLLSRYFSGKLNKTWKKTGRIFTEEAYQTFRKQFRANNESGIFLKKTEGPVLTKMIEKSKALSATVNELIICALVASLQKNNMIPACGPEIGIAINIRNDVVPEAHDCLGNFVSGVLIRETYDFEENFEENLSRFKRTIRDKIQHKRNRFGPILFTKNLEPDFIDSIYFAEYGLYDNRASKQLARILGERNGDKGIGISNLGRIELREEPDPIAEDMVFIPPAYPANRLNLGIITYNGHMNICFRYFKKFVHAAFLEPIYIDMVSAIMLPQTIQKAKET
jgi:hypothetical protein